MVATIQSQPYSEDEELPTTELKMEFQFSMSIPVFRVQRCTDYLILILTVRAKKKPHRQMVSLFIIPIVEYPIRFAEIPSFGVDICR